MTLKEQIMKVRDTGETNMFDCNAVQVIANRENLFDLVLFIEDHRQKYKEEAAKKKQERDAKKAEKAKKL